MLQIIANYITNEKELSNYENTSHKDSFEYMPLSKGKSYSEIVDVDEDPVNFLAIKITTDDGDTGAVKLLKEANIDTINLKVISKINRVFSKFKDEFEVNSISYQKLKLRSEGVLVNALITTSDGEPLLEHTQLLITALLKNSMDMALKEDEIEILKESGELPKSGKDKVNSENDKELNKTETVQPEEKHSIQFNNYYTSDEENDENENNETENEDKRNYNDNSEKTDENIENIKYNNKSDKSAANNNFNSPQTKEITVENSKTSNVNPFGRSQNPLFNMFRHAHIEYNGEDDGISDMPSMTENNLKKSIQPYNNEPIGKEKQTIQKAEDKKAEKLQEKDTSTENTVSEPDEDVTKKVNDINSSEHISENQNKEDEILEDSENILSEPDVKDVENSMLFIHKIYDEIGAYTETDINNQQSVYDTDTDVPFLNEIDKYIPINDIKILEEEDPIYELHEEDYGIKTTASEHMIKKAFQGTMEYFMENESLSIRRTLQGEKEVSSFMEDLKLYVNKMYKIPEEDKELFFNKCYRALFSYYVLTPAINNPDISDIRVLAPDNINVKVHGIHYTAKGLSFLNTADYNRFIESLIIKNKVSINNPIVVFTDKDFNPDYILRFNLCLPMINSTEMPYLHIRKVPKEKTTVKDLINAGMMDNKIASYLLDKVISAKGIVFAGPSASGKTTAMNAFIDYIPKEKSILCIQESEELFSNIHPNAYFQHMLKDPKTGKTVIGLSELGQNGLLCDSGYFIIGECKGAEVRDLLRASNTGHKCWCSVHSQNTRETIPRLADYVKYGSDYSLTEATRMLKDLEVIVYIESFKIQEISEIVGYDEDRKEIIYKSIYKRSQEKNNKAA